MPEPKGTLFPPKSASPLPWSKIESRLNLSWTIEKGFWLLDQSLFHLLTSKLSHITSVFRRARSCHSPLIFPPAVFSLLMHSPHNGPSASFTLCSKLFQMLLISSLLSTIKAFLLSHRAAIFMGFLTTPLAYNDSHSVF